jgi:hypothetical protein
VKIALVPPVTLAQEVTSFPPMEIVIRPTSPALAGLLMKARAAASWVVVGYSTTSLDP